MAERRFDDRVAVITGGGRGLGRAYALLLASKGAKIVVNDPGVAIAGEGADTSVAAQLVAEIEAAGGQAVANTDSVATPEGGQAIIQSAIDHYGRIDILIHNAGNVRYGSLDTISYEDFRAVVDVHLLGAFHVVRPAFPLMTGAGYGRIILTSSIGGIYGTRNVVNYGMSKAAMIGLNNVVAIEGAEHDVKSNIILPGAVTRMADGLDISQYPPMGPELVAPVVGWLAHESCPVSGEMFSAIGGRVARARIVENEGVFQPSWTIDEVADQVEAIRTAGPQWAFPATTGYIEHLQQSFAIARAGIAAAAAES
ncbi:SDR family NAD(P)-dependent oxidoreductase [Sphingomonas naphthae]|uniref:SDR family NAD(P)-dependent oxidoreductase n=1 Tax=Sphingomonas naphthae TaxID=1813468 RepID=A0ABY7TPL9_9SPHN|nr:SDR family NAD(P)-dependent oxidoreductase [Sphingomonas naphthae]WCT75170.1 SDR family NAD(P)-dependent oxidoreductase [Sphingomonas naphthae]